jgi:hypothetical protein
MNNSVITQSDVLELLEVAADESLSAYGGGVIASILDASANYPGMVALICRDAYDKLEMLLILDKVFRAHFREPYLLGYAPIVNEDDELEDRYVVVVRQVELFYMSNSYDGSGYTSYTLGSDLLSLYRSYCVDLHPRREVITQVRKAIVEMDWGPVDKLSDKFLDLSYEFVNALQDYSELFDISFLDVHTENVGFYKGQLVPFDIVNGVDCYKGWFRRLADRFGFLSGSGRLMREVFDRGVEVYRLDRAEGSSWRYGVNHTSYDELINLKPAY